MLFSHLLTVGYSECYRLQCFFLAFSHQECLRRYISKIVYDLLPETSCARLPLEISCHGSRATNNLYRLGGKTIGKRRKRLRRRTIVLLQIHFRTIGDTTRNLRFRSRTPMRFCTSTTTTTPLLDNVV